MIKLYIDNQQADINPLTSLSVSLSIASLTSTSWGRANYSKSITIPATPLNRRLMGDCEQPLTAQMFNHRRHTARVEVRGCVIIEGTVFLTASRLGADGYYRFNIIGNAREWVVGAEALISTLFEDWSTTLSAESIAKSLTAQDAAVRFLPVDRGTGRGEELFIGRVLPENYHPFLHLATLVEAIFAKAGYAVESEFIGSDFFRSLYMSGRWSTREHSAWGEEMAFVAERTVDSPEAEANHFGRVYADPLANYSTVGNLVDVFEEGSGCFALDDTGRVVFTPTREVAVAFDYHLRWVSDYRIKNRNELQALTELRPTYSDSYKVEVKNNFPDRREGTLSPSFQYTFIVFDLVEGATYKLLADEVDSTTGEVTTHTLLTTTERSARFSHRRPALLRNARVEMHHEGFIGSPASDWAIYDGFVSEVGYRQFEATFRSMPERCSPEEPKYFDLFYFGGGVEGQKMHLLSGCSVRPVLYPHPMVGDELRWGDVANIPTSGLELLGALKELFDLQIYTDPLSRKVCIEPRREYCDRGVVIDLSERIDTLQPIVVEELGGDHPQRLTLRYRSGDGVVEELRESEGEPYGEWSATIDNVFASEGARVVENAIFTPSISTKGVITSAPSASLIRVDGATEQEGDTVANLNFLPKIVAYRGMHSLPKGEKWNYPEEGAEKYPLLTFYDDGTISGKPLSLLFEDRDGVVGLHKWWDDRVDALNHSRRITLYVVLNPEEVEQVVVPNSTKRDFRAHYLLDIEGEKVLCRMEEIVDYNPTAPSTKVVFVTV